MSEVRLRPEADAHGGLGPVSNDAGPAASGTSPRGYQS